MKTYLAVLLSIFLLLSSGCSAFSRYESVAYKSSGALFLDGEFFCSGTEIGKTSDGGGVFLTARHCVVDLETGDIHQNVMASFSENEAGPFFATKPIAISLTDDLALLYIVNGASIPTVSIKDENRLKVGDTIFAVSYPLSSGKLIIHGEYLSPKFPHVPGFKESGWSYAMPINLSVAPGSSGGGIFSDKEKALIGVVVGKSGEGSFNVAIPSDRVLYLISHISSNTVEKFKSPDNLENQ